MRPTAAMVNRTVMLELIDATGQTWGVAGQFRYDANDPFAVVADFHAGPHPIRWLFARDLLAEGVFAPIGEGDVAVWPCLDNKGRAVVVIELSSPHGHVLLQTPSADVVEFLQQSFHLVARGTEDKRLDLDSTILQLLGHDRATATRTGPHTA